MLDLDVELGCLEIFFTVLACCIGKVDGGSRLRKNNEFGATRVIEGGLNTEVLEVCNLQVVTARLKSFNVLKVHRY